MQPTLALSVAWFDLAALGVLAAGVVMGLRRGLSGELLPLAQWLAVFLLCGLTYEIPGVVLAPLAKIQPGIANVICYLALAAVILGGFALLRRAVGQKLLSQQQLGAWDAPLGALAGAARCACLLLVALALLNARYVSPEEEARLQTAGPGSLASALSVESIQHDALAGSRAGHFARAQLGGLFIKAQPPAGYFHKKIEGLGKKMERAIDEGIETTEKKQP